LSGFFDGEPFDNKLVWFSNKGRDEKQKKWLDEKNKKKPGRDEDRGEQDKVGEEYKYFGFGGVD